MQNYSVEEKDFSHAMYISPSRAVLEEFNRPKEKSFPNAKYIWPFGCVRFHTFRLFSAEKKPVKAEAAFLCDNLFDLWINGRAVVENVRHMELCDVTEYIRCGENNIHIRAYQSGTDESFSSAITGGIRLWYEDGTTEEIVTDESFKNVKLNTFWETEEPKGFETETAGLGVEKMNVMCMHPIALRRSFRFVRDFAAGQDIESAYLYSSALGCYEPYLNGERISDSFFMPFCMNLRKEYQKFDIKPLLRTGKNVIGAVLGNGSYNCRSWGNMTAKTPEFIAMIEIKYCDGSSETIVTDDSWRCFPSPLIDNDIQYGERYDARLERDDLFSGGADMSLLGGVNARSVGDAGTLIAQSYPPVKRMKEHKPRFLKHLDDGAPMYDTGACIAGRARVKLCSLPAGKKVRIRYCERLNAEGAPENGAYGTVIYQNDTEPNGKSPEFMRNMDVYFAKGAETETYECRFAYTGFRYIWIEGLDSDEQLAEITAFELYNDLPVSGEIRTDDGNIMKIFNAAERSWLNNLSNGPTDCPTREKNYWNGDTQIFSHMACWLTDNSEFLARWTDNGVKMHAGPYAWEDETYELPYTLYKFYGDKALLKKRFPAMLELVEKRVEFDGMILPKNGISHQYNDWLSPCGVSPNTEFFGGCWYYHMLDRISEIAEIIGENGKAAELRDKAEAARCEFNRRHLNADKCDYDAANQCGIVLPLAFGIAPAECRQALADTLVKYIEKEDWHLTTGFVGTRYILDVLSDYGYAETAYRVFTNPDAPSWLGMLSTGATAITESWHGLDEPDRSISMSHFSLGAACEWLFETVGGIKIDESDLSAGKIVLRPVRLNEVGSFKVRYRSVYGEITAGWKRENGRPEFYYTVPEGFEVELHI